MDDFERGTWEREKERKRINKKEEEGEYVFQIRESTENNVRNMYRVRPKLRTIAINCLALLSGYRGHQFSLPWIFFFFDHLTILRNIVELTKRNKQECSKMRKETDVME